MSSTAVILLAAGNSSRYGGPKLLQVFDGQTLVRRAAQAAQGCGGRLWVVTGAYAQAVREALDDLDTEFVHNARWAEGMGSSIACAFQALRAQPVVPEAAIVLPADLPRIGPAQLQRLIDAHRAQPQRLIVSCWGAAQGPPCLFPQTYFAALASLRGPQGARAVLQAHADDLLTVPMPEAAADIDTVADLEHLRRSVETTDTRVAAT